MFPGYTNSKFPGYGSGSVGRAWYFYFNSDEAGVDVSSRCFGRSVRGVID